jgi:hypothetical protein
VSRRPLVFVSGLTIGDYLLWNWSLNSNHDLIALVSGLTLPPLTVMLLWLLVMSTARLLARTARRPVARRGGPAARATRPALARGAAAGVAAAGVATDEQSAPSVPPGAPSRKIAA